MKSPQSKLARAIVAPTAAIKAPVLLNALRAFEASARHKSIKAAALELRVTPSAVSHQIRHLERFLGSFLFERSGRGITLTGEGALLLPKLASGFELIAEALSEHQARTAVGPLRLSVLETFALYWLIPRLKSYPMAKAGFDLRISATQRLASFETDNVDVAIRLGIGPWANVENEYLFAERVSVYASPEVSRRADRTLPLFLGAPREVEWMECRTRLSSPWAQALPIVLVDCTSLAIKAAVDGAGYCFAGHEIALSELDAGRLVPCSGEIMPSCRGGYWLLHRKGARRDPRIRNFRSWLLAQVETMLSAGDTNGIHTDLLKGFGP